MATVDISLRYLLSDQIKGLERAGYSVLGLCAPGDGVDELRRSGMDVATVPMSREIKPLSDLRSLFALIRFFRAHKDHVVITHTPKAGLLGPLAARLAGVRLVVHTVHGFLFHDRMPPLRRWVGVAAEVFTARFAHHLFFQSYEDLETARRMRLKRDTRLHYVGNGIDTARFDPRLAGASRPRVRAELGISGDRFVVGTVGRLVWEKGYRELFEAARQLASRRADIVFLVVGPSEPDQNDAIPASELEAVQRLPNVRLFGHGDDMPEVYAAMDMFVLASHREGIPRGLMEASAMELPVAATDIRGCREVVEVGRTGYLFPVRDAAALAAAIETVVGLPDRGKEMGRAGRQRIVESFDERVVIERIRSKLDELLGRSASEPSGEPAADDVVARGG